MQIRSVQSLICRYKRKYGYGLKGITGEGFQILGKGKIYFLEGVSCQEYRKIGRQGCTPHRKVDVEKVQSIKYLIKCHFRERKNGGCPGKIDIFLFYSKRHKYFLFTFRMSLSKIILR